MREVAAVDGIFVTRQVVTEIIGALGALDALARRRNSRLSPRIEEIRRELMSCIGSHDTVRTQGSDALGLLLSQSDSLFDVGTAAQQLGLSSAGVRYLIHADRIAATYSAGRWHIPADEVAAHRAARIAAGKLDQ